MIPILMKDSPSMSHTVDDSNLFSSMALFFQLGHPLRDFGMGILLWQFLPLEKTGLILTVHPCATFWGMSL